MLYIHYSVLITSAFEVRCCILWPVTSKVTSCDVVEYEWVLSYGYWVTPRPKLCTRGKTCTRKAGTGFWWVWVRVRPKVPGGYPCHALARWGRANALASMYLFYFIISTITIWETRRQYAAGHDQDLQYPQYPVNTCRLNIETRCHYPYPHLQYGF